MPKESMNAREAAFETMAAESAATMADEMAARWWGKNDCGEARDVP